MKGLIRYRGKLNQDDQLQDNIIVKLLDFKDKENKQTNKNKENILRLARQNCEISYKSNRIR